MTQLLQRFSLANCILALLLGVAGCEDDSADADSDVEGSEHPLLILTEKTAADLSIHYLHILTEWPKSKTLDYSKANELGKPGVMHVEGSSVFFWHAQDGVMEKYSVDSKLKLKSEARLGFTKGIMDFSAEPIWVNSELAFMLDEKTAQIARFNPKTMELGEIDKIAPAVLDRDGLKVQFQNGVADGSRIFTAVNWRSWESNNVYTATVLGTFDEDDTKDGPKLIEDKRCAASVAVGPFVDGDYIYQVGDGVNGFDILANEKRSPKPQCVVRLKNDADGFDADYFIDLQEVTKSPAIYMAYPMGDHKLLVSMWNPDVDVEDERKGSTKADWFWAHPARYVYAIVDLETKDVKPVDGIPEAKMDGQKVLMVDDTNYVQTFRDDKGSDVYSVDADGKATQVLKNQASANVQYLGRL